MARQTRWGDNKALALKTASFSATVEAEDGRTVSLNSATGFTVTLPKADGTGAVYTFVCPVTVTSGSHVIQVANATDSMVGLCVMGIDVLNGAIMFYATSGDDTITMNGTTTGGLLGDSVVIRDIAEGLFHVLITAHGTGNEVSPFSAA